MESDIKYIRIFSRDSRVLRFSSRILDLALMSFPIPARFSILAHPKTYSSIVAIEYQCKRSCGFFFLFFFPFFFFFSTLCALLFSSLPPRGRRFFTIPSGFLAVQFPPSYRSFSGLEELRYLFRAFSDPRPVVKKYQTIERISRNPNRGLRSLQFKKTYLDPSFPSNNDIIFISANESMILLFVFICRR